MSSEINKVNYQQAKANKLPNLSFSDAETFNFGNTIYAGGSQVVNQNVSSISVLGGIIGIILGMIIAMFVGRFGGWPVVITGTSVILSFAFSSVVGIFFGWHPARKATNLNPIDALRYE